MWIISQKAHGKNYGSLKPLIDINTLPPRSMLTPPRLISQWRRESLRGHLKCVGIFLVTMLKGCYWLWETCEEPGMLDSLQCLGPFHNEGLSCIPHDFIISLRILMLMIIWAKNWTLLCIISTRYICKVLKYMEFPWNTTTMYIGKIAQLVQLMSLGYPWK